MPTTLSLATANATDIPIAVATTATPTTTTATTQGERNRSPLQQQDGLNSFKSKSSTRQEIIAQSQFRPRREYPPPAVLFQVLISVLVLLWVPD
jgi:hypothetical protein